MPRLTFQTNPMDLRGLLEDCESGSVQLPDFQRGWVWDEDRIISLIGSIARAYPIGAIMALKSGVKGLELKSKCIEGVTLSDDNTRPDTLILDGQQRITSLYQVSMRNQVVNTVSVNRKKIKRWFYLDIKKALENDQDITKMVISIPENKMYKNDEIDSEYIDLNIPSNEYFYLMFPVTQVFDWDKWQRGFTNFWQENKNDENQDIFVNFKNHVLENFSHYQVPIITLENTLPKAAVCTVFEKVNTTGKALDAFELLTAIYAAHGHNLRDDWYGVNGRKRRLENALTVPNGGVYAKLSSIDFLQTITLFHTRQKRLEAIKNGKVGKEIPAISCSRQAVLDLPMEAYQKYQFRVEEGFKRASQFLLDLRIFHARDLPYQSQLIPLAAILSELDDDWDPDIHNEKLIKWYWNGVLGELYGSSVDHRIARDFIEVLEWLEGGREPLTISESVFRAERLNSLRTRTAAAYKGIYALILNNGAMNFFDGKVIDENIFFSENIDIHHIFSKKIFGKLDENKNIHPDSIINKTPISHKEYKILRHLTPVDFFNKLENTESKNKLDDILSSHLIRKKSLFDNDLSKYLEHRKKRLCDLISVAMGKQVIYDTTGEEFEPDEDDEE